MAQAGRRARGADAELARAHHGSVSRSSGRSIEEELKSGRLPAVVATCSLELGIDMGAVDLVVQVESPPSVASGLQRVGRAGHQVGAVSRGRASSRSTAATSCRPPSSPSGCAPAQIEALRYPRNPLDVLAQQIVAMVAHGRAGTVDDLLDARPAGRAVRRRCRSSALDAVLDMLAGRYPSDEFAELRPRIVWDRVDRHAHRPARARSGSRSPAAAPSPTAGCSASSSSARRPVAGRRARRGDGLRVAGRRRVRARARRPGGSRTSPTTGCSSPRRPGSPGRLPFWHGDALGRPVELGRALGRVRARARRRSTPDERARAGCRGRARRAGRADNLLAYLAEQREATGHVPDDRTIVVERFRDELGDWRLVVHSPFGAQVHAPWALAIAARLRERYGVDVQAMHADDGIVLRLPETELDGRATALGGDRRCFDPDEVEPLVTDEVGGSALFASPVPRVRGPRAAAAAPQPGPAHPAVAAAAALGAAAAGGERVRRRSRSCSRRCASACRTSSTCPGSSG